MIVNNPISAKETQQFLNGLGKTVARWCHRRRRLL